MRTVLRAAGAPGADRIRHIPDGAHTAAEAAGHSHAVFPLSYDELVCIAGGTVVEPVLAGGLPLAIAVRNGREHAGQTMDGSSRDESQHADRPGVPGIRIHARPAHV